MRLTDLLRQHRSFLIPYLIFIILTFYIELKFTKGEFFLLTNQYHSIFFDWFFKTMTFFGDVKIAAVVIFCLCLVKYRYAVLMLGTFVYISIIARLLKMFVHSPRPTKFFEGIHKIHTLPGYDVYEWNSFPSGHSTTAFSLAIVMMHLLTNKFRALVIFPLVLIVMYSRVYLAQHFFQDVVAGSVLATVLSYQFIWWLENAGWYNSTMLDGSFRLRE